MNKDCQQSSLYHDVDWRYGPQTAVDGDTSNDMSLAATCVTTVLDQQPYWWTVNLGKTYTIDYITIYSRGDCCSAYISIYIYIEGRRGRDRIVVGFTTSYGISAYHHQRCEFESRSWRGVGPGDSMS